VRQGRCEPLGNVKKKKIKLGVREKKDNTGKDSQRREMNSNDLVPVSKKAGKKGKARAGKN